MPQYKDVIEERIRITTAEEALRDLGTESRKPAWLESEKFLPFASLTPDEFEILCFLLLLKEKKEGESIYYYGKTRDAGRDIIRKFSNGDIELIQCKHYSSCIRPNDIKKELVKLCKNIFFKKISVSPKRITFYVSKDLTAQAKDFISNRNSWTQKVLYLFKDVRNEEHRKNLEKFALNWWPAFGAQSNITISERVEKYPDLKERFFALKKVLDVEEVKQQREEAAALRKTNDALIKAQALPEIERARILNTTLVDEAERRNPGLGIKFSISSEGTKYVLSAKEGFKSIKMGTLFVTKDKARMMLDEGRNISLEANEFSWKQDLDLTPIGLNNVVMQKLHIEALLPKDKQPVKIVFKKGDSLLFEIPLSYLSCVRWGEKEQEFSISGGKLPGTISLIKAGGESKIDLSLGRNIVGKPLDIALTWFRIFRSLFNGATIMVDSLEHGHLFTFSTDRPSFPAQFRRNELFLSCLKTIEDEFHIGLVAPETCEKETFGMALFLSKAIRKGKVFEKTKSGTITFALEHPDLNRFPQENGAFKPMVLKLEMNVESYSILGHKLPAIQQRTLFQKAVLQESLEEIVEKLKALPAGTLYDFKFDVKGIIHEFPKWIQRKSAPKIVNQYGEVGKERKELGESHD